MSLPVQPGLHELKSMEADLILKRRIAAGYDAETAKTASAVGVALSGGGIRSATFCLGLFQGLANHGLITRMDYLSTVSGGGYFGSFLGRIFTRGWVNPEDDTGKLKVELYDNAEKPKQSVANLRKSRALDAAQFVDGLTKKRTAADRVTSTLTDNFSMPVRWLRASAHYLTPGGQNDGALAVAVFVRNWLSLIVVMLLPVFTAFLMWNCFRSFLWNHTGEKRLEETLANWTAEGHLWWTPAILFPVIVLVLVAIPLGAAFWLTQGTKKSKLQTFWAIVASLVIIAVGIVVQFKHWGWPGLLLTAMAVLSLLIFGSSWVFAKHGAKNRRVRKQLSDGLRLALIALGASLIFATVDGWGQSLYAIVAYSGTLKSAWVGITGAVGLPLLAPLAKRLVAFSNAGGTRFKIPTAILATVCSLALVLVLSVATSFVAQGMAWDWDCPMPAFENGVNPVVSLYRELFPVSQGCKDRNCQGTNCPGSEISIEMKATFTTDLNSETTKSLGSNTAPATNIVALGVYSAAGSALCLLFGLIFTFLNLSSFHTLYTARLVRAYLGASNPERWKASSSIKDVHDDDDIDWFDYRPHSRGGPLHLVNVALNSTVSLESDAEFNTAKSLNLCVSPAGLSFGHQHALSKEPNGTADPLSHIVYVKMGPGEKDAFAPREIEPLRLGDWVGISGAAVSTGLGNVGGGKGTAIGTSLLCGLFNVRLGYWWKNALSFYNPRRSRFPVPVQSYLLNEFTGQFDIQDKDRWYLTDGGHFENTAAYELIRRQVPFIVVADCGADPDGNFDDIANLARRIRLDFGADLKFLNDSELKKNVHEDWLAPCVKWRLHRVQTNAEATSKAVVSRGEIAEPSPIAGRIGILDDLHPFAGSSGRKCVRAHAALAHVRYPGAPGTLMLLVKPGITEDLPADLLNYQQQHANFPQQSTLEQFFDEAQWESYRKLGQYIADLLFKRPEDQSPGWYPYKMTAYQF
ncbi:MAG TPA: hypothetical protein VMF08_18570 [Candidatus Sulfotelmatobacter sp.]|nr:hypothetical protein [Candidatus Sulfotelmatobacter sp.]